MLVLTEDVKSLRNFSFLIVGTLYTGNDHYDYRETTTVPCELIAQYHEKGPGCYLSWDEYNDLMKYKLGEKEPSPPGYESEPSSPSTVNVVKCVDFLPRELVEPVEPVIVRQKKRGLRSLARCTWA